MKMLFNQAVFKKEVDTNKIDGINSLYFEPSSYAELHDYFEESKYIMTHALSLCDMFYFDKVYGQEIFCIYYNYSLTSDIVSQAIQETVVDGKLENIVNSDEVFINESLHCINTNKSSFYPNSTIFWDVNNHMIIIIGKENCLRMAYALETESFRNFQRFAPIHNFVTDTNIHSFTRKIKAFNHNS